MASFQAKIGWKWLLSFCSVPTRRVRTNYKKKQKNSKIPLCLPFKPKQVGKGRESEKIKIVVPFLLDGLEKIR